MSRRLDALFAERVMGMLVTDLGWVHPPGSYVMASARDAVAECVPCYTQDLSAAWEGVETVGWCELSGPHRGAVAEGREGYWARVEPWDAAGRDSVDVHAGTPALAVVLACLQAVGVGEEEIADAEAGT